MQYKRTLARIGELAALVQVRMARIGPQLLRYFRVEHKNGCDSRRRDTLEASIDQMNGRTGKLIADEYSRLKGAV
jgi:hypothetical protein